MSSPSPAQTSSDPPTLVRIAQLVPGGTAEFFARLAGKEPRTTRDGKPFFRLTFQDASGHVPAMVWHDSPHFADCQAHWKKGTAFRITGRLTASKYGSQLELASIRETCPSDAEDGFDELNLFQSAQTDPLTLLSTLLDWAKTHIASPPLRSLVEQIHETYRDDLLRWPAASRNHHAFPGGYLEHVVSVTENAIALGLKYRRDYPDLDLSMDLLVAGAILHDIGKLRELSLTPDGGEYTPAGRLLGHMFLGRDLIRELAAAIPDFDSELLMNLEHILISHQGLPEWGSPIRPATPEALLVHYADDIDAKFHIMASALANNSHPDDPFTTPDNPLRRMIYRRKPTSPTT